MNITRGALVQLYIITQPGSNSAHTCPKSGPKTQIQSNTHKTTCKYSKMHTALHTYTNRCMYTRGRTNTFIWGSLMWRLHDEDDDESTVILCSLLPLSNTTNRARPWPVFLHNTSSKYTCNCPAAIIRQN